MLVLLLTYALTVPGMPIAAGWGSWSPTQEGLLAGAVRVLRLSLMLIGLAVLLVSTARERLIYGLYVLLRPGECFGVDRRALAVRLGLTLEYIERESRSASMRQWLARLKPAAPLQPAPEVYRMQTERWRWHDSVLVVGVAAAVMVSWI